ncbi:MAG: hypothetical protein K8H74_15760 [Notoacmeibacter sp.]|nr:hypothetical protein [Notoacmeibacter sp.]
MGFANGVAGLRLGGSGRIFQTLGSTLLLAGALAGCATGNILTRAETDPTIITGSIPDPVSPSAESERASDELTIRNAVSSANLQETGDAPIAWANQDTGARGSITRVTEYKDRKGVLCRAFTASLERFDGVSQGAGEACLGPGGNWTMRSFGSI